jgi:DNA polymerase I
MGGIRKNPGSGTDQKHGEEEEGTEMTRWVFDAETDALLMECTKMWCLGAQNLDTKEVRYWREGDHGWMQVFDEAEQLIGHNVLGFDFPMLEKLFGYKPKKTTKVHDTLIMSQAANYRRFGMDGHSLEAWGIHLGFPKIHVTAEEFHTGDPEKMMERCLQDVGISVKVYSTLIYEVRQLISKAPQFKHFLRGEHVATKWASDAQLHGWPFDVEGGKVLFDRLSGQLQNAHAALSHKLGFKCVPKDMVKGIVDVKKPKWTKDGFYDSHTAKWFDVDPCSGFEGEERPVAGEFCRVECKELSLDSVSDMKIFLFRNGWEPTEWNSKTDPETGKKVKTSPKITEDSLEFLGGDGKLYTDFLTVRARHGILKTWLENVDAEGNLHGDCMMIGTPSMRARHSIIVNVPAADSAWGPEMRSLFRCKPGWKLIGCDSTGNQARGLAYYLGDEDYIKTLLTGDIHRYNARKIAEVLKEMGIEYDGESAEARASAKRILYAFLFGASGGKLWSYLFGGVDEKRGNKFKNGFIKAVPGFRELKEKLENIYGKTSQYGDGYIPSIAGNRIYVDSFHKLLVYLLQAFEKATCSAALTLTAERLEAENIPYLPCIYYHDEIDFQVPEEHAERAAAIGKQAFTDGPKLFGVEIMDGGAKIGDNWYEVH